MKLLQLTEKKYPKFEKLFEEVERGSVEDMAPRVIDGERNVKINGNSINDFDAVYAEIPCQNAVFGRVMLEMIEEEGIKLNYSSTGFFIMSKKNYLYNVLHEKEIPSPKTISLASQKAGRDITNHLELPFIGRKFQELEETEKQLIESQEEAEEFLSGTEYPKNILLFHSLNQGNKYKCLFAGGTIISLEDTSEGWRVSNEDLQYSNPPSKLKELTRKTAKSIGTPVAEVILRGEQVIDVNPNPDLEQYTEISGKSAEEAVAEVLSDDKE